MKKKRIIVEVDEKIYKLIKSDADKYSPTFADHVRSILMASVLKDSEVRIACATTIINEIRKNSGIWRNMRASINRAFESSIGSNKRCISKDEALELYGISSDVYDKFPVKSEKVFKEYVEDDENMSTGEFNNKYDFLC